MKRFAYIRNGEKFTVDDGKKVYTKTGVRSAEDKRGKTYTFNTRDWVSVYIEPVKKAKVEKEVEPEEKEVVTEEFQDYQELNEE